MSTGLLFLTVIFWTELPPMATSPNETEEVDEYAGAIPTIVS